MLFLECCYGLDAIAREEKMVACCPSAKIKSALECQKVNKSASVFQLESFQSSAQLELHGSLFPR